MDAGQVNPGRVSRLSPSWSDRLRGAVKESRARDPRDFLPLTHLAFHVLLAVSEHPRHGYGIVGDVRDRSGGRVDPGTGSFYSVIHGLAREGLLQPAPAPDDETDDRRRYYQATDLGRRVLAAETSRLKSLIRDVERRGLGPASSKAGSR
jgi:DNA-binding PadR family transcriptional regulator